MTEVRPALAMRWWIYQRERFPLAGHGVLVLFFSAAAVCFSALLRGDDGAVEIPALRSFAVAFFCCLLIFLQLRIADEFKDNEEDRRWRPYRPVPRGLVTLRELAALFAVAAVVQATLAAWLSPKLLILLLVTWAYLAAMSVEFGVGAWLRARPLAYLLSHMFIMPLIDLMATGCDWTISEAGVPGSVVGLAIFLLVSYGNGVVIELGRKIRDPADEEEGVPTYSAIMGRRKATFAWLATIAATAALAIVASGFIDAPRIVTICTGIGFAVAAVAAFTFLRRPSESTEAGDMPTGASPGGSGGGKRIEVASAIWTILLYAGLGPLPLLLRIWIAGAGGGS